MNDRDGMYMHWLRERIQSEGRYLGNGILKVDVFMNHQVDPLLMQGIGYEFARRFRAQHPSKILTAEISGIAPALATGMMLQVPVVFARKTKPLTLNTEPYQATAPSHTKGGEVTLMVSHEFLSPEDRILIIDDFLASALTIRALAEIVRQSGAPLVGIGAVIEKAFEGGRGALRDLNVQVESLAVIEKFDGDKIIFAE
ncbi:MAG: xanthine phosphoribosyltransferase [Chloroflexota bacterium]|nr:MAG: xanthine phosphoribosyltransferase [Chloroflexota bacterium]